MKPSLLIFVGISLLAVASLWATEPETQNPPDDTRLIVEIQMEDAIKARILSLHQKEASVQQARHKLEPAYRSDQEVWEKLSQSVGSNLPAKSDDLNYFE